MPELSPRITYSPDGILEVRHTRDNDDAIVDANYARHKEVLDAELGYEVTEEGLETIIQVQVDEVIDIDEELTLNNLSALSVIKHLGAFTYFNYEDPRDGVFSIDFWSDMGASGVVYPQFQRWLNAGGLQEEVARRAINALAIPLGKEAKRKAEKDFFYVTDGANARAGFGGLTFGITSKREDFDITYLDESGTMPAYRSGEVAWNWVKISTIGSCACWGPAGEERSDVILSHGTRLYEMEPHNIDSAAKSLSLVLGAATLAYEAAKYPGSEDILEHAVWRD